MRVGFLFNHEGGHQVAHGAPIAFALSQARPDIVVEIFYGEGDGAEELKRLADIHAHRCTLTPITLRSPLLRAASRVLGDSTPLARIGRLRDNLDGFRNLAALVVPEKTSLMLKTHFGLRDLKMVHTRHGAGDRAIGFDKASGLFDYVLVSGKKVGDRLMQAGLVGADNHAIIGYPKFDLLRDRPTPPKPFANDRPTVLYNPHPSPRLSSWYSMGQQILEYFRRSDRYNLIFAPHVMLFRKRWTLSINPPGIAWVGDIGPLVRACPHILIDTGSRASVDMTHALAADIYLGDASSQVYEFLIKPRPCIFANPQSHQWRDNPDFSHWRAGAVIDTIEQLDPALRVAAETPDAYRDMQQEMFAETFDIGPRPSSQRAADALSSWLQPADGRLD